MFFQEQFQKIQNEQKSEINSLNQQNEDENKKPIPKSKSQQVTDTHYLCIHCNLYLCVVFLGKFSSITSKNQTNSKPK